MKTKIAVIFILMQIASNLQGESADELVRKWESDFSQLLKNRGGLGYNSWDIKQIERWESYQDILDAKGSEMSEVLLEKILRGKAGSLFLAIAYCSREKIDVVKLLGEGKGLYDLPEAVLARQKGGSYQKKGGV